MKAKLTAMIMKAPEGGYWSVCPEIPGANGQGETVEESKESLAQAVKLLMDDRLADCMRDIPQDALVESLNISLKRKC